MTYVVKDARQDLHMLEKLFKEKLNYQVFITCDKNAFSESLTLDNLNDFLPEHEDIVAQSYGMMPYDGLIFIWCGYNKSNDNNDINLLYTSDNETKYFGDIQQNYYEEKQDSISTRAQIDAQCINDKDVLTIFVKSIIDTPKNDEKEDMDESSADYNDNNKGSYFVKLFCQSIENNMDKSFQIMLEQVAEDLSNQNIRKDFMRVNSTNTHLSIYLTPRSHDDDKDNNLLSINKDIPESLNFHRHHSLEWIKANVKAVKIVQEMIDNNEQGLIVVTNDISHWKTTTNCNEFSFHRLINNDIQKLELRDYWVYIIKSRLIILEEITIDGNVYAIQCEIQCKENVNITTQLFVTSQSIIDPLLTSSISPIQWNKKIHHDIPIQFQYLENRANSCTQMACAGNAIVHLQNCLHLSIQTFGNHHPYVANAYSNLGSAYRDKECHNKAIECHEVALKISLDVFGINHAWTANLYDHLGVSYRNNGEYGKAIDCHRKALNIRLEVFKDNYSWIVYSYNFLEKAHSMKGDGKIIEINEELLKITKKLFGKWDMDVGGLLWKLGLKLEKKKEYKRAYKYYEEAWEVYTVLLGEWNIITRSTKQRMLKLC
ncbi:hypothetical protein RFI_35216 [Reticulomyxa filosa]|uniref:TPR repeat-containing protein n=1 Tax=Reticulomyxa filosa TaxID=46433 RepID=X6LNB4_RETFI|nr:hypothetical protein RFI_35216 [Reticulomyxa filosa]|eukprot:ETO02220.1 hypothetical protein RFI_35216 [Reticulomyxa filosa]